MASFTMPCLTLIFFLATTILASPGKRGLPFNNPSTYIQNFNGTNSRVSWAYNWDSTADAIFPHQSLTYVPLLWSASPNHITNWAANVAIARSHGSKHLLAFNEPDGCGKGQACMTPQAAVDAYKTYMMPYAASFLLGAPAVTNGPKGLPWLKEFIALCTGCKIDFVPVHWYDAATNVPYFRNYMASARVAAGGRDIWITEFNGRGTLAQQTTFLQTILPWLDAQPWIQRYAWQWCSPTFTGGTLVLKNGMPSPLGLTFGFSA